MPRPSMSSRRTSARTSAKPASGKFSRADLHDRNAAAADRRDAGGQFVGIPLADAVAPVGDIAAAHPRVQPAGSTTGSIGFAMPRLLD